MARKDILVPRKDLYLILTPNVSDMQGISDWEELEKKLIKEGFGIERTYSHALLHSHHGKTYLDTLFYDGSFREEGRTFNPKTAKEALKRDLDYYLRIESVPHLLVSYPQALPRIQEVSHSRIHLVSK